MKKGFTLTELICVIIIIGILVILAIPSITNLVNNEKNNISSAMESVILQAGELYTQDNSNTYLKNEGNIYCIKFNELIEQEYLSSPLKDSLTGKEIDTNKYVKVSIENLNYNYSISDTCEPIQN